MPQTFERNRVRPRFLGGLGKNAVMSAYEPTYRENIQSLIGDAARWFGADNYTGSDLGRRITGLAEMSPLGALTGMDDANRAAKAGNYGQAVLSGGLALANVAPIKAATGIIKAGHALRPKIRSLPTPPPSALRGGGEVLKPVTKTGMDKRLADLIDEGDPKGTLARLRSTGTHPPGGYRARQQQIDRFEAMLASPPQPPKLATKQAARQAGSRQLQRMGLGRPKEYTPQQQQGLGAMDPPEPPSFRAYHGSPYDFAPEEGAPLGRFREEAIGSGEGNAAFGEGTYLAENELTAKTYRDRLSKSKPSIITLPDGTEIPATEAGPARALAAGATQWAKDRGGNAIAYLDRLKPGELYTEDVISEAKRWVREGIQYRLPGRVYETKVHADLDRFLDWDKPIGLQSEAVREAIAQAAMATHPKGPMASGINQNLRTGNPNLTGEQAYLGLGGYGTAEQRAASQALLAAGVPGLKYLDEGSRFSPSVASLQKELASWQHAVEAFPSPSNQHGLQAIQQQIADAQRGGTRNFVVFDPGLIEIVKKYGLAAAVSAGLVSEEMGRQMQAQGDI